MSTQLVLVPGFWLGAWAWDDVLPSITGHEVTTVTLPGLEPGGSVDATLDDHCDAIIAALNPAADRRVLVVHSGAAVPGTMVIDHDPALVDQIVYVDSWPTSPGGAINPDATGETFTIDEAWDELLEEGSMAGLNEEQLATLRTRAVPQPGATVSTPVNLTNRDRHNVPVTVIASLFSGEQMRAWAETGAPMVAELLNYHALSFVDIPTGHWPMFSKPGELGAALSAI